MNGVILFVAVRSSRRIKVVLHSRLTDIIRKYTVFLPLMQVCLCILYSSFFTGQSFTFAFMDVFIIKMVTDGYEQLI